MRGCLLTAQDPDLLQPKATAMNAIRPRVFDSRRQFLLALAAVCGPGVAGLSGCAAPPQTQAAGSGGVGAAAAPAGTTVTTRADVYRCVNRLGWGATAKMVDHTMRTGYERFVDEQLKARASGGMPTEVQAQIDALTIQKTPMHGLLQQVEALRKQGDTLPTEDERKAAQKAYQQELSRLAREAATRHLLRAVYSEHQLFEHMTWFWFNHFNVHQYKGHIRAMLGRHDDGVERLGRLVDRVADDVCADADARGDGEPELLPAAARGLAVDAQDLLEHQAKRPEARRPIGHRPHGRAHPPGQGRPRDQPGLRCGRRGRLPELWDGQAAGRIDRRRAHAPLLALQADISLVGEQAAQRLAVVGGELIFQLEDSGDAAALGRLLAAHYHQWFDPPFVIQGQPLHATPGISEGHKGFEVSVHAASISTNSAPMPFAANSLMS
mgnify:CR=1 FL=1